MRRDSRDLVRITLTTPAALLLASRAPFQFKKKKKRKIKEKEEGKAGNAKKKRADEREEGTDREESGRNRK